MKMDRVLVVVDVQNDFVSGSLGTPEAVAVLPAVVEKILGFDGRVVYTMDTHGTDYLGTREGRLLPVEHCIECSWGWENPPEVAVALESKEAEMYKKSTFASSEIAEALADTGSVELIGLCTDVCVISNALMLRSRLPEADIRVDGACCAGTTLEMHRAALDVMRSCQILVG